MEDIHKRIVENEARLRIAIESSQLGTWEFSPFTGEMTWSNECYAIHGLAPGTPIDLTAFEQHIHPEDRGAVSAARARAIDPKGTGEYDVIYRIYRFDNSQLRWIHPKAKVSFNANGEAERFVGSVVDITEYKIFEDSLRASEQRARIAIEAANMGTFDWNLSTSEFYSSERLIEIFGFEALPGVTHEMLVARLHPDDKPMRDKAVADSLKNGALQYEARIVWPDASVRWIKVHGKVIQANDRRIKRMYGIVVDVTEQKNEEVLLEKLVAERTLSLMQSNEELKKSEERYTRMTEEVQDYAILLLSNDGYVLNWNQGAERIKGYRESEIIGKHFRIFYLPEDQQNKLPEALIREAVDTGRSMHEGWRIRKDNTIFWGSSVITALHDSDNHIVGFTKVTRDLTERKLAEDQLRQYNRELEAQNKELEQFAYIASHDLQEPLRKIRTFTEVLEKNIGDPDQAKKYLEKISSSARRMTQLVQSVLDYSRLSAKELVLERVDLNQMLTNVKTDLELLIAERQVTIRSGRLPVVKGIPVQLQQLFFNLISNAVKFSDKMPVIEIHSRKLKPRESRAYKELEPGMDYVELEFRDNGIGFEQQYADRIFTIFQRLHGQKSYPGTGIGLALCQKIADNHHGHIRAESEPGKGASFFVYLLTVN
ncbi:PAS domain-containing sensor histidine kinase [Sediminibacterium soli]|uniref:PAS domain-containing sensor histidine kinase n=1 Tax=Sediminibacterium soli TaxID=2698829 RepID=UPI00137AF7BD|nr:PAS domain-containing protein [Sediminibacterium soli]NCI46315.1 PAS domain-containing protein [Sediminibacterium soli]